MPVITTISEIDFPQILSSYSLGEYQGFRTFDNGAGQTTVLLLTTQGKCVLRYYENRSMAHVFFEVELFNYLTSHGYPVPSIIKSVSGKSCETYKGKPFVILEFIQGEHGQDPNFAFDQEQLAEVVMAVAHLHALNRNFYPASLKGRASFNVEYCWREYQKRPQVARSQERADWLRAELDKLEFAESLPKGICHADLNYGNFLFRKGKVVAVLDFDMSFYSCFIYDVASLIYWWAWPPKSGFKPKKAARIVSEYQKWRELTEVEKRHIYDALKLIILLGINWSGEEDFESEKSKIEFLNSLGRQGFYAKIFSGAA